MIDSCLPLNFQITKARFGRTFTGSCRLILNLHLNSNHFEHVNLDEIFCGLMFVYHEEIYV